MSESDEWLREELWRQYAHALDEYRFQVQLNWDRTKYLLTLDIGVIPAGTALLGLPRVDRGLVAAVYLTGIAVSVLGVVTLRTQRDYYQSARQLKGELEERLGLGDLALQTTPGMRAGQSVPRGLKSVRSVQMAIFVVLGLVHLGGVAITLAA